MPKSEIDDIFASSKSKGKALLEPVASTSSATLDGSAKSKKKSKKRKLAELEEATPPITPAKKTTTKATVPETVVDSSLRPKKTKTKEVSQPQKKKKATKGDKEDEEKFKDSRGSGPRTNPAFWEFSYDLTSRFREED
jgi:hypothetical protein